MAAAVQLRTESGCGEGGARDPLRKLMSVEYACCPIAQRSDHDCFTNNPFVNRHQMLLFDDMHQQVGHVLWSVPI